MDPYSCMCGVGDGSYHPCYLVLLLSLLLIVLFGESVGGLNNCDFCCDVTVPGVAAAAAAAAADNDDGDNDNDDDGDDDMMMIMVSGS